MGVKYRVEIVVLESGELRVNAPPDKVLALGMMELAKQLIANMDPAKPSPLLLANGRLPKLG